MRISGARLWSAHGLAEETIMMLGDRRTLSVLRHYIGLTGLTRRMLLDLKANKSAAQEVGKTQVISKALEKALLQLASSPDKDSAEFAVVASYRRPHKWHHCSCRGPSGQWRTECGDAYNGKTMHVQRWAESNPAVDEACRSHGCGFRNALSGRQNIETFASGLSFSRL